MRVRTLRRPPRRLLNTSPPRTQQHPARRRQLALEIRLLVPLPRCTFPAAPAKGHDQGTPTRWPNHSPRPIPGPIVHPLPIPAASPPARAAVHASRPRIAKVAPRLFRAGFPGYIRLHVSLMWGVAMSVHLGRLSGGFAGRSVDRPVGTRNSCRYEERLSVPGAPVGTRPVGARRVSARPVG